MQPESTDAYLNLGAFYAQRGLYRKALKAYLQGLMIDARDEFINSNLASMLYDKDSEGNYEITIGYIEQAIAANPERMLNYKIKGDICFNMELYQEAVNEYQKAMEMKNDPMSECFYSECCCGSAKALVRMGKFEKALEMLEKGLEEYPDDIYILLGLSAIYIGLFKNYGKGIYYANKVIEIDPENTDAYKNFAKCYSELGV